jgi:hypothetical protein
MGLSVRMIESNTGYVQPILRYYPRIYLMRLRKNMNIFTQHSQSPKRYSNTEIALYKGTVTAKLSATALNLAQGSQFWVVEALP